LSVLVPLAIGVFALALLLLRERVAAEPMLPLRLFRDPTFSLASTISALSNMTLTALVVLVPINYQLAGVAANQAGILLIPVTAGTAFSSFFVGHLVSRSGRTRAFR